MWVAMNENLFRMFSTFMEQYKPNPSGTSALKEKGTDQQEPMSSDEECTLSSNGISLSCILFVNITEIAVACVCSGGKIHNVEGARNTHDVLSAGSDEETRDVQSDGSDGKTHNVEDAGSAVGRCSTVKTW